MLTLEKLRKIDPTFADMSDEELEPIRAELYALGEISFDTWRQETGGFKNPLGLLTESSQKDSMNL